MRLRLCCGLLVGLWALVGHACNCDNTPTPGTDGGGGPGTDANQVNPCTPTAELCDALDNDCDQLVDEDFDFLSDNEHCGGCNQPCNRPNRPGSCANGQCEGECDQGYHDINGGAEGNDADGCEYGCRPTNNSVEICDRRDNDCNGSVDETFDLSGSIQHCGGCNKPCAVLNATPVCSSGNCTYTACNDGFADVLDTIPGCEYTCPVLPTKPEECNNVDDDCDGAIDEDDPEGGGTCGTDVGECEFGTVHCVFGQLVCQGGKGPSFELCDGRDNDCDGEGVGGVDEGFDKQNDPRFCGASCTRCNLPNAIEGCVGGECVVRACLSGWADRDGDGPGCGTACPSLTPEVCDGVDNDCDGLVDGADPSLIAPPNFCITSGACGNAAPVCGPAGLAADGCDQAVRWRCVYQAPAEVDSCGNLVAQERLCDGVDGDCDGVADDSYPMAGTPCAEEGAQGVCQGTGTFVCNSSHDDVRCEITTPGTTATAEVCDNLDNDCDGHVDVGAPDDMVHVVGGGLDFYIYAYEAARPDATATSVGTANQRSCTKLGMQPWRNVSWSEADTACRAAGRRLCSEPEWQQACQGVASNPYPYGATYLPAGCNGKDYSPDCVTPDQDTVQRSGRDYGCPSSAACRTPTGIYDLSGNLKEWTGTQVSSSPARYRVRGGAYDSIADGLTCQFSFVAAETDYRYGNLGFRCCSDTP